MGSFVDVQQRLELLRGMNKAELRSQWLELFDRPVGQLRKDLLIRILSYRIQEQAYGGLSSITRNHLRHLARVFEKNPKGAIPSLPTIKPGTRLLRQWQRQTHTVTILEDGFEYKGNRYASLSQIARLITGTRWSGPLFFGLKGNRKGGKTRGH